MKEKSKALLNALLLVLTLVVNFLGASGLINGLSQKAVSDMYPSLITPAAFAFSIWGVIYTLLIASLIVMIVKSNDDYYKQVINEISLLFWLTCVFNIIWIVCFSYNLIGLSSVFIFLLFVMLLLIDLRLGAIQTATRWLVPAAFGMYSGWLFIATVVNITAWLVQLQWNGFGLSHALWAVILLIVAIVLTVLFVMKLKNALFPVPIAWAFWGIYKNVLAIDASGAYKELSLVAVIGAALLVLLALFQLYRNKFSILPTV
jgi:hypothetical protein